MVFRTVSRLGASIAVVALSVVGVTGVEASALADTTEAVGAETASDERSELEALHRFTIATRRDLSRAVLIAGVSSAAGGGALMATDANDQAWRLAGLNTAIFGLINTVIGIVALRGIAAEEAEWNSPQSRSARQTTAGLARARVHAIADARRESVAHAINLGLDGAYLSVATMAIITSRLGVTHPNRWLASGVAIGAQSLFLVAIDAIGLAQSSRVHGSYLNRFVPSVALVPSPTGTDAFVGLRGTF